MLISHHSYTIEVREMLGCTVVVGKCMCMHHCCYIDIPGIWMWMSRLT